MIRVLREQVRRDRVILPVWIIGIALLLSASAVSVVGEYGDAQTRSQILLIALATPALLALRGIPNGDALGSAVHFQSFAFLAVAVGLMNTFLATRHGRADEEKGRRELILGAPVSRLSPLVATLVLGMSANALFAVLAVFGYLSAGLPVAGSVLSAMALAATGAAFLGVGMLGGELVSTSRAANGIGLIAVLGAYALRAIGDAVGRPDLTRVTLEPGWPSWLSPIGWGQQTLAFTDDRWWPVLLIGVVALVAVTAALLVQRNRELGASLLPERLGRPTASIGLDSVFGLAWRLQRPTLVAWTAGTALLGLVTGSLVTAVAGADVDSPQLRAVLASLGHSDQADVARQLIAVILVLVASIAAAAGVQAVLRMRDEETDGRLDAVLATPRSRVNWIVGFTAVGAVTVIVVLVIGGLAAAVGFASLGDVDDAWLSLGQALVQIPAILTVVGFSAMMVGLVPRFAIALSWAGFVVVIVIGLFGDLLDLPDGVEKISPISSIPVLPEADWVPTAILVAIAVALAVIAAVGMRRRDVST